MPIVSITNQAPKPPTKEEMEKAFLTRVQDGVKQEGLRRKQFIETLENAVWDPGVQVVTGQQGGQQFVIPVGLTPEEKIKVLNDAGISVPLFKAGAEDRAHLAAYVGGIVIKDHPNKVNYDYEISEDGKEIILKKKAEEEA